MKKEKLEEYKKILLELKQNIVNGRILRAADELAIVQEDLADEADLANNVINQQVNFTIRSKEMEKLRAIEMALYRIEEGTFGICEDCDEPISEKRLKNQPWAHLCITHAEEEEREQQKYFKAS